MRRWLGAWGPALAWAALIFAFSARPTVPVDLSGGRDKVAHFGAYFVFGALLARSPAAPAPLLALGWLYAASDEVHQRFVPGRSADAADWAADALGVAAGLFVYRRAAGRKARRSRGGAPSQPLCS